MSTSNQGRALETEIEAIANAYEARNVMRISKVEPPVRLLGTGIRRKTIFLRNPFLDFVGSWTERGGRAIFLEAKSTTKPQLPLFQDGGITENQWAAILQWRNHGAATGVLWGYDGQIRFVPVPAMISQQQAGVKHIKWDNATPVPKGEGWVTWDFVHALRLFHPSI